LASVGPVGYYEMDAKEWLDWAMSTVQTRTWVGLTDDEFNELYDKYVPESCYALLIEKVEAKLKERNQ